MKKIFQIAVVALVGLAGYNANAQEGALSVKAGINFNGVSGEGTSGLKRNIGFHAGVAYEMQLGEIFYVEPGVFFDTMGTKYSDERTVVGVTTKTESKTNIYAISVPVLARVKFQIGDDMTAFFNAGPYMSVGLSGKTKFESTTTSSLGSLTVEKEDSDIKFGSKAGETNLFGFGLHFGAGVTVKRFIIGAGYDLGLTEIAKDSKQKFNAFKITLGYQL